MVHKQANRASSASKPMSAAEALMLELESVTPQELERLSLEAGLAPDQAPEGFAKRGHRMDRRNSAQAEPAASGRPRSPSFDWALAHKPVRDDVASALPTGRARVHGDSMRGAGIADGDFVELDLDMEPQNGDIVLAHVEGVGRVLRTLKIVGGAHVLKAACPSIAAIAVDDPSQITFHGVVIQKPLR